MKHIKTFNEAITYNGFDENFQEELKDFCEMGLTYLLDDTAALFVTNINDWDEYSSWKEDLHKIVLHLIYPKKWDEIKDQVIPFLIRLNKKYEVNSLHLDTTLSYNGKYKIEDLINDKTKFNSTSSIYEITLYIEDYKREKPKGVMSKIKSFFK
jgi:hypothetical protein